MKSDQEKAKSSDDKSSSSKPEKESKFLDPWSQAIATFGMPKIPKKKSKVSFSCLMYIHVRIWFCSISLIMHCSETQPSCAKYSTRVDSIA